MRFYKAVLRTIILLVSTLSFLGGWILLAHSLKPTSSSTSASGSTNVDVTPLPTLTPLQGLDFSQSQTQSNQQQSFSIVSQPQIQTMPVFTTSGS